MKGSIVILAHVNDASAACIYTELVRTRGQLSVMLVVADQLAVAPRWQQTLSADSQATELQLADGTSMGSDDVGVVLNRIRLAAVPHLHRFAPPDRDYVVMEFYAFLLSWLHGLKCPVLNRPSPRGLGDRNYPWPVWLNLVSRSGLPAQGYHWTTNARRHRHDTYDAFEGWSTSLEPGQRPVQPLRKELMGRGAVFSFEPIEECLPPTLIAGNHAVGPLVPEHTEALRRLRDLSGCDMLQLGCGRAAGGLKVTSVTAIPQITRKDELDAVVRLLTDTASANGGKV